MNRSLLRPIMMVAMLLVAIARADAYEIRQWVIGGGGGIAAAGVIAANGTIGQSVLGTSTGDTLRVVGGFWSGAIRPVFDVDGNGHYDALTDGLLVTRYLFGLRGASLTSNAVGAGSPFTTPAQFEQQLAAIRLLLDIDGDGTPDALTDGLLLIRYLFGVRGGPLINSAVASGATRTSAQQIEAYIQSMTP
jgi:hypothetical protein